MPIGLSPPGARDPPFWPILTSLLTLPFPWKVVPAEPPDCLRCFTALCWVHMEEGNGPRRCPEASRRTPRTGGGGTVPNGGCWASLTAGGLIVVCHWAAFMLP